MQRVSLVFLSPVYDRQETRSMIKIHILNNNEINILVILLICYVFHINATFIYSKYFRNVVLLITRNC